MCVVVVVVMGLMIIAALLGLFCELVVNSMSLEVLNKRRVEEAVLRWQRNRMGRPFSPPQIY